MKTFFLEITTISGQNSEFRDKIKVKTFFLEIATISGQNSEFGDEIEGDVEKFCFFIAKRPLVYFRYVDDTFAVFNNEKDCNTFFIQLNSLHPSLRFTCGKESNHSLPFLDVLVERHVSEFLTSVYRKPTFTGQYLRWNSFSPQKRKINLISTLVHRAFMICSKSKLDQELGKIRSILLENGYPERVINSLFKQKLQQLNSNPVHTVKKCPVYLHIPWIGNVSMKFEKQITSAVKRCFSPSNHVLFSTPDSSFQRLRKTCCLPIITAMLFTSFCATAIVGTLVARLNG